MKREQREEQRKERKKKNVYQTNNIIAQHQTWRKERRGRGDDTFIHHTPAKEESFQPLLLLHTINFTAKSLRPIHDRHSITAPIDPRPLRRNTQPKPEKKRGQKKKRPTTDEGKCYKRSVVVFILFRHYFQALAPSFFFCFRGGVIGRPPIPPAPYGYLAFFSAGLRICHTHTPARARQ